MNEHYKVGFKWAISASALFGIMFGFSVARLLASSVYFYTFNQNIRGTDQESYIMVNEAEKAVYSFSTWGDMTTKWTCDGNFKKKDWFR